MNKNIVVFGCDNSGKTTLCENIVKYINETKDIKAEYVRSLGPNKKLDEQVKFMKDNLSKDGVKLFDRFPLIEERVCGRILRGEDNFQNYMEMVDLLKPVDLFVMCYPGLLSVLKWGDREQLTGVKENIVGLINGYNWVAYDYIKSGFNVTTYNYNIPLSFSEMTKTIDKMLEE